MQLKVTETYLASEAEGYGFYFLFCSILPLLPLKIIQSFIASVSKSAKGGQYYLILRFVEDALEWETLCSYYGTLNVGAVRSMCIITTLVI